MLDFAGHNRPTGSDAAGDVATLAAALLGDLVRDVRGLSGVPALHRSANAVQVTRDLAGRYGHTVGRAGTPPEGMLRELKRALRPVCDLEGNLARDFVRSAIVGYYRTQSD